MGISSLVMALSLIGAPEAAAEEPVYRHRVAVIEAREQDSYAAARRFSGRALARQRAELAFELDGRVEQLAVDEGDQVVAGEVLVSLDTRLLDVERDELRARLDELRAQRVRVERELERHRSLQRKGYSAQKQIDDLVAEWQVLRAQQERTDAALAGVELRREKSVLKAPFAGEVVRIDAEVGVIAGAGRPLLRLVESGHSEALIGIPATLRNSVTADQTVTVLGEFGQSDARVLSVSETLDPTTLTHMLKLRLPDDLSVADSSIVYLQLDEHRQQRGFWLPLEALVEGVRGTWAVYVVGQNSSGQSVLEKHGVEPIHQQGARVFVRAAFGDGTPVVSAGVHRLAPGQLVAVQ